MKSHPQNLLSVIGTTVTAGSFLTHFNEYLTLCCGLCTLIVTVPPAIRILKKLFSK